MQRCRKDCARSYEILSVTFDRRQGNFLPARWGNRNNHNRDYSVYDVTISPNLTIIISSFNRNTRSGGNVEFFGTIARSTCRAHA